MRMRLALMLGVLFIAGQVSSAEEIELFNGKDMTGWTYYLNPKEGKDKKMEDVWSVENGVIICTGKPAGYIRTEKEFENYVLTLEWRWPEGSKGGNSGVLLHTQPPDKVWPKSVEAQLMANNAGDIYIIDTTIEIPDADKRRKDRRHINLTDGSEKPPGEWNQYEITCKGDEIILKVNGELVNHATNASVSKGAICLQSEGAEVHFRNIKLKTLD